jgi:type II secretory pathway pseudopilin PulG
MKTKNSLKNRLTFSLIELLIVILVLSILTVAIVKGGRIIRKAKLNSAQSLTQSSIVNFIPNLVIWLETTLDRSFADKATLVNIESQLVVG